MGEHIDKIGIRTGMWLFLYSEIILFGGLFVLYAAYFHEYPKNFAESGRELNRIIGSVNTVILLLSSFTVASSITAIQRRAKKLTIFLIVFSILCGATFLTIKYFEWGEHIRQGIYPNSQVLQDGPPGNSIFFGLYYVITGLHGLHVIIGMTLLSISLVFVLTGRVNEEHFVMLENAGLYWHLVDMIWIFVFPLFYLIL